MPAIDKDLWHRCSAAGTLSHLRAQLAVGHHVDLFDPCAALFEKFLGSPAIGAEHGGVDFNLRHTPFRPGKGPSSGMRRPDSRFSAPHPVVNTLTAQRRNASSPVA